MRFLLSALFITIVAFAHAEPTPAELFSLGQAAYEGRDNPLQRPDFAAAYQFFRQAADVGHMEAAYLLGLMFYRGDGLKAPDYTEAARYYMLSAAGNFPKAQYNLAVLYYEGRGLSRDDTEAYRWLLIAAANGEPRAQKMLSVASRNLSAAQKSQAESSAKDFLASLLPEGQ